MKNLSLAGPIPELVLQALARYPGLGELDAACQRQVAEIGAVLQYEPGEIVIRQGDRSDAFFLLLQGAVAVEIREGDERRHLGKVSAPFSLGEVGCLLEKDRTATITAVDGVVALRLTALALRQLMGSLPELGFAIARFLASRLDALSGSGQGGPAGLASHAAC